MIVIGRHINGVVLNPMEYVLDKNNDLKSFESEHNAKQYLLDRGMTPTMVYEVCKYIKAFQTKCNNCGHVIVYIEEHIKKDKDGDYIVCPSCESFMINN